MELYFLRHGIAAETSPDGNDASRALTREGIEKMRDVARAMRKLNLRLDVVLSSPLVRAHETAQLVARELRLGVQLADELTPGCDLPQLFTLLGGHRVAERVLLVGHEPDFSGMIAALTGGVRVQMKKGGLARVDTDRLEAGAGTLIWLMPPRVMRNVE